MPALSSRSPPGAVLALCVYIRAPGSDMVTRILFAVASTRLNATALRRLQQGIRASGTGRAGPLTSHGAAPPKSRYFDWIRGESFHNGQDPAAWLKSFRCRCCRRALQISDVLAQ